MKTLSEILIAIRKVTGVHEIRMISKCSQRPLPDTRTLFAYFANDVLKWNVYKISEFLKRDRTTIINMRKAHTSKFFNKYYKNMFYQIKQELEKDNILESVDIQKDKFINSKLFNKSLDIKDWKKHCSV